MADRIAIIAAGELFGGVERQVLDLHAESRRRAEPRYQTLLYHDHTLAAAMREAGESPEIIPATSRYDLRNARRMVADLVRREFQVIHAHGYRALVSLAAAASTGLKTPPVVKTEHGLPELGDGLLLDSLKVRIYHRLDRWATHRLDATVCYVTDDIRHRHDSVHSGLCRHTVHNGIVPLSLANHPHPQDLPEQGTILGIVGRVSDIKGIEYAIAALADDVMPEEVRIMVFGTGPQEKQLQDLVDVEGLGDRINFLGFRTNIHDYIAHLDALLMPSLHEGLPYTLLEAMSLGKPVLASNVGGLAEVLRDNETGLLFPPRDPAAIARACRRLVEEPDLGPRLGAEAARVQRERYTLDAMLDRYVEIYEEAIERRRRGG